MFTHADWFIDNSKENLPKKAENSVFDWNEKDFPFPQLHIQSLSFLDRWAFYEICSIRRSNNRDESGGDCEFALKHPANICRQTSSQTFLCKHFCKQLSANILKHLQTFLCKLLHKHFSGKHLSANIFNHLESISQTSVQTFVCKDPANISL